MKLHQTTLPTTDDLARYLGLGDLRIGRHFSRNEAGELTGCIAVSTLWHAEVVPSFHPRIALAVVTAVGEVFKECRSPDFVKGVMATPEAVHAIALDKDPMREALSGIDLFCGDQTPQGRNGIAYTFTFQTKHLHGTLQFGNPSHHCLRSLENALLGAARRISSQSGEPRLVEIAEAWDEFIRDK
jgi:hypothetical protein